MQTWFKRTIRRSLTATAILAAAMYMAGCTNDGASNVSGEKKTGDSSKSTNPKPMTAPDKMGQASATGGAPKTSAQPSRSQGSARPDASTNAEGPTKTVQRASAAPSQPPPAPAAKEPDSDDVRREQAENLIYATIRVKMEEAVSNRAKLLKEGRDPSDPQIRQYEGTIMRARELLIEAGEVVEEVDPPIVQTQPKG